MIHYIIRLVSWRWLSFIFPLKRKQVGGTPFSDTPISSCFHFSRLWGSRTACANCQCHSGFRIPSSSGTKNHGVHMCPSNPLWGEKNDKPFPQGQLNPSSWATAGRLVTSRVAASCGDSVERDLGPPPAGMGRLGSETTREDHISTDHLFFEGFVVSCSFYTFMISISLDCFPQTHAIGRLSRQVFSTQEPDLWSAEVTSATVCKGLFKKKGEMSLCLLVVGFTKLQPHKHMQDLGRITPKNGIVFVEPFFVGTQPLRNMVKHVKVGHTNFHRFIASSEGCANKGRKQCAIAMQPAQNIT